VQGDCDDTRSLIYPGAEDTCNDGIDQDCNGADEICPADLDQDGDNWSVNQGDCNDNDRTIYPGATEICGDGIDQDCDGNDLPCSGYGISGTWMIYEYSGNNTCGEPSGIFVDSYPAEITYSGQIILDDNTFYGTIAGNTVTWSGSHNFPDDGGTITITNFRLTTSTDGYSAEGYVNWSWTDGFDTCSGTSNIFADRTGSL
jgi:hypothetical protein